MSDKVKGLSNDDVRSIHAAILADLGQSVASVAKELGPTPAALYYRFDALELEAPDDIRIKHRNEEICLKFAEGTTVKELRKLYKLSTPSIYSILHSIFDQSN